MTELTELRPRVTEAKLLEDFAEELHLGLLGDGSVMVTGVTISTDLVRSGDIFVAAKGRNRHGASLATVAKAAGAVAILTDLDGAQIAKTVGLPILVSKNPRRDGGLIAKSVYSGEKTVKIYGVTGTNGKTITVYLLAELLELLGKQTGISSTAERRIGADRIESALTTPEAPELHAMRQVMAERGIDAAVFEVSAQAYTQQRLAGIEFDVLSFLNFSQDHLDDYQDLESYYQAKAALFSKEFTKKAVISVQDSWGIRLAAESEIPYVTVGWADSGADWLIDIIRESAKLTEFSLCSKTGDTRLVASIQIFGSHIVFDAAVAILMLLEDGVKASELADILAKSSIPYRVPGRMELVSTALNGPAVFVDYGHTPEAFNKSLAALRQIASGKIIMVFGADGDRDTSKRAAMAEFAVLGSDLLVITDYNPRFEDPAAIRAQLLAAAVAVDADHETYEIAEPAEAIRFAISKALPGDIVFWAGPGHETHREVAGAKLEYSSIQDAKQALIEAGWR